MSMIKCCKRCEWRRIGCHGFCEAYKQECKDIAHTKAVRKAYNDADSVRCESAYRQIIKNYRDGICRKIGVTR